MERAPIQIEDSLFSILAAVTIGAEPSRCWRNAVLTVLTFPPLFAEGTYIEGWIVVQRANRIEIVEHGWCRSPLAGIVDPTIVLRSSILTMESWQQAITYFPGFEVPGKQIKEHVEGKTVPLVCNAQYGQDGMEHPGYKRSYEQADQHARKLADQQGLPATAITVSTHNGEQGFTIVEH